jgi:Holliday junction resolvase RusA-like endonuclease
VTDLTQNEEQPVTIELSIIGTPQPAGSKRGFRVGKGVRVVDANPKSATWKREVLYQSGKQYNGPLLRGPLQVRMVFTRPRPKGHFGTGRNAERLKPSAPQYPTGVPDVLKLTRGVEDALTGVVWYDDAQIVSESISKVYGEPEGVQIVIEAL